ncbi:DUF2381 family protein [Pyxidicoccus sp. MSG2]|nr:DUF2381 family protein [Pyxidicoccus sp. MSG2]
MSARLRVLLLAFVALRSTAVGAQEPPGSAVQGRTRRIELTSEPPATLPEISIQPGIASLLLFDAPLASDGVELEGKERFRRVVVGEDTVALVPSEALREGERLRLTVRFVADATPGEAHFLLVVVPGQADTQVEVLRVQRNPGPARNESTGLAEELQQLREENARLRAERASFNLLDAITAPWMQGGGIAAEQFKRPLPRVTGADLELDEALSFRAASRVAVKLTVTFSRSERPWSLGSAALIGPDGQRLHIVQVWQSKPTAGDAAKVLLVVEAEAAGSRPLGPHTLELREAGGDRTLRLGSVAFPDL